MDGTGREDPGGGLQEEACAQDVVGGDVVREIDEGGVGTATQDDALHDADEGVDVPEVGQERHERAVSH
jgi:hypothetical protein